MENCIEIKELNKFYGKKKQALSNVNLTIGQGMFGLLGRNGAGKTTLMKTLATLLQKQSGSISVCGIPIENAKAIRKIIGYLPQDFSIYPTMNVIEVMDYLGILSGIGSRERKKRIELLLKKVNLIEQKNKKVKALSGGMKRRLGIAQALLNDPKVLIVDEPTAGLDPEERIRFRNLLCDVAEERIVILSTHIVGDIEATCENLAILNEGSVLYCGKVSNLLNTANGKVFSKTVDKRVLPKLKKKYNIIGMHFFNPADRMKLVEVISGENTPVETKEAIIECSKSLGKTPVEVAEGPGFVVNRILIPMINEACFIYQEGLASVEDIDTAMKLGANHPMGPLALGDLIGLDIVLDVMEVLYTETGDPKYRPCTLLKKMVRAGKLGQKTKQGFYSYN